MIIGITGCSGSGKSKLAASLVNVLGSDACSLFTQDNYYIPRHLQPKDPNGIHNFDLPESLNLDAFELDLTDLAKGKTLEIQQYNYNNPNLAVSKIFLERRKFIIVEGLFIFHKSNLLPIFDLKIFVETDMTVSFNRRLNRDLIERGYDFEDVNYRFHNHVIPCYNNFIEPHKNSCDIIFNNSANHLEAITIEANKINEIIKNKRRS